MGLWKRIKQVALTDVTVLVKGIDHDMLEDVERVLIEADFGPATFELVEHLEEKIRRGELKTEEAFRSWLVDEIAGMFTADGGETEMDGGDRGASGGIEGHGGMGAEGHRGTGPNAAEDGPKVVVLFGVNGVGKTTQAAKLAHRLVQDGKSVILAAADTFRAGAAEQLSIWAERLGVPAVTGTQGGDPAAVAFDAVESATARGTDVVIVDTAGRLHTESDLMTELQKIVRVIGRRCQGAPHESFLVLDGTVGQNAVQQGKLFSSAVPITGLIVTKLDGTARGGAVVSLQREIGVPVRYLGVGEALDDLIDFEPRRFAERLLDD
jgi:fused signal recognition particle receptor